jgi:hypothetical protein
LELPTRIQTRIGYVAKPFKFVGDDLHLAWPQDGSLCPWRPTSSPPADGILTLRGRVAWARDYDPSHSIGATFQSLPGASFVVNGAAQASDSALVTASIEKKWLNGWSAAATFEGEFSDVTRSYAGKGVVRYQW